MKTIVKTIITYLKEQKRKSILYIILIIITEVAFLSSPLVIGHIIDAINNKNWNITIYYYAIVFVALSIIDEGASRRANTVRSYLGVYAKNRFTSQTLAQVNKKDYALLSERGTGKLQKRIDQGVDAFVSFFYTSLSSLEAVLLRGIMISIILAWKAALMLIALIIMMAVIIGIHHMIKSITEKLQKKINNSIELQGSQKTKIIMEYLFFRIWNAQKNELGKLDQEQKKQLEREPKNELINELPFSTMAIGFRIWELGVYLYYGYQYVYNESISIGTIMALVTYIWRLRRPVQNILNNLSIFRKNINRRNRLQDILTTTNTIKSGTKQYEGIYHNIVIKDISFSYKKNNIFNKFSCILLGSKTTAIIGHSGSGKSTLIKLLLRLYDPQYGSIMIDNQQLSDLDISSRYDTIGYISQESSIIEGTIKENLLYGIQEDKKLIKNHEEKIWRALEQAHISELIQSKEKLLETKIGEKGLKLSGGEKQKLALARLFIKNPPIIILDEPTSALDSVSEHHITESLKKLTQGKTVIIIAHRLQTVMHADHIIVMEQGKVVEQGTHEELINHQGSYSTMVDLQHGVLRDN